jgi:hypothetical protein
MHTVYICSSDVDNSTQSMSTEDSTFHLKSNTPVYQRNISIVFTVKKKKKGKFEDVLHLSTFTLIGGAHLYVKHSTNFDFYWVNTF